MQVNLRSEPVSGGKISGNLGAGYSGNRPQVDIHWQPFSANLRLQTALLCNPRRYCLKEKPALGGLCPASKQSPGRSLQWFDVQGKNDKLGELSRAEIVVADDNQWDSPVGH